MTRSIDPDDIIAARMENGTSVATISAGFSPNLGRFLIRQPALMFMNVLAVALAVVMVGTFAGFFGLRSLGGWWAVVPAFLVFLVGVILLLVLIIVVWLTVLAYPKLADAYKNGLLVPGVVVSAEPLKAVVLASLGNGSGPSYHGLQSTELVSLPCHSHTPGTRVPFAATFEPGLGMDRWMTFDANPVAWGTGNSVRLDQCARLIGDDDFRRLEALVASGTVPRTGDEMILLDEHDTPIAQLSIEESKKLYRVPT